jgi:hypothetical protein
MMESSGGTGSIPDGVLEDQYFIMPEPVKGSVS